MKRARCSCFTSSERAPGSAFAWAPSTGEYEAADPVELRLLQKRQKPFELRLGLTGEAARVDYDKVSILIAGSDEVSLGSQLGEDAFGID